MDRKSHSDQTEGVIKMDELIMLESMPPRLYLQQQADRPDEARLGFDALRLQVESTLASPPRNCSSECSNLGHQSTTMYRLDTLARTRWTWIEHVEGAKKSPGFSANVNLGRATTAALHKGLEIFARVVTE